MFSKFKKVLVSLALASSLALAPMNVSAANEGPIKGTGSDSVTGAKNENNEAVQSPAYLKGTALGTPKYTVEVSPSITIDLDDRTTSASDLDADNPQNGNAGIYIKLTEATDFDGKNLKVTPKFAILNNDPEISFSATDEDSSPITGDEKMTLSALGVTNSLLKFGTYDDKGDLKADSNIASFAEGNAGKNTTAKSVSAYIDATLANNILKKIPNEIKDSNGIKSASKPQIADNQQIGNVTFDCEFSS